MAILRQRILLALCALAALAVAIALWITLNLYGASSARWIPSGVPFVDVVASVDQGSPPAEAGLRVGDRLDIRDLSPAGRLRFRNGLVVGETVVLPVRRDGERKTVTFAPWPETKSRFWREDGWDQVLSVVGEFWAVFVAALIVWRRPDSYEAQLLALVLILSNLGTAIAPQLNDWVTPWPVLDLVCYAVAQPIISLGTVLLATYALQFGRPVSRARSVLTAAAYTIAAVASLAGVTGILGEWFGAIDSRGWFFAQPVTSVGLIVATSVLPLACAALALRDARGNEAARLAWAAGSLSINYLASIVWSITELFGIFTHFGTVLVDIAVFLTPLGLTYALLNRRLLDVGFVLNRAAVFTTISLLVVGAFSLVEWALGSWLEQAGRVENLAVNAVLVLILGLSIHPIHSWVDRVVDNVFFRKRHEDERALRQFGREAAFMTSAAAIVERAKRELAEHTDGEFSDLLVYDGASRYGDVDENDPALVALRASGAAVDLAGVETALRGERAYPMMARGRLVGALIVGPRRSGETYAPDESEAIAEVARGVGVALDLLGVGRDRDKATLADAIAGLDRSIKALPDAIVDRLRGAREALEQRDLTES